MQVNARALHAEVKHASKAQEAVTPEKLDAWRTTAAATVKDIISMERKAHADSERHAVEMAVMREEMRSELVLREATAARTAERFRVLSERTGGGSDTHAYDMAVRTAGVVEESIRGLCSHALNVNRGCQMLCDDVE